MTARTSVVFVALALAACGSNSNSMPDASGGPCTTTTVSGMGVLQDFCEPADPGPNAFLLSASGEVLALTGYRFPPAHPGDFALVDGWDITYANVISTFDHARLSSGPDRSCTDKSQTGPVVAEVDGPWAIDLHKGGSLVGKGGPPEEAAPIVAIRNQNTNGHAAFDPSVRYAFGFDVVTATAMAKNVNLDAAGLALYEEMIAGGCTTMLVGQAVWKGNNNGSDTSSGCTQSSVSGPAYDFSLLPKTINFKLCLPAPTSYENAENPENDPATPCESEEHQRGVRTVENQASVIQATFHIDHVLWESFVHDSPAHFDTYAAKHAGETSTPTVTMDDYHGYAFNPFVDKLGKQVPWRSCVDPRVYTLPSGVMIFDTSGVTIDPAGDPATAIRDFYDFIVYNHGTFGHLNSDGLSFVRRNYPSPP